MIIRPFIIVVLIVLAGFIVEFIPQEKHEVLSAARSITPTLPVPTTTPIPDNKILSNNYHIFQSFNNCGPASLSMALSYFGINKSQEELGQELRPWQHTEGIQDDKSVTLAELENKAKEYDLIAYHRPNGSIEIMEQLIAADIPVITRTWLHADEDIGHYRVVKGYDKSSQTIVQDDSFQDKNLVYTYDEFNEIWEKFNYEYLVIFPKEKEQIVSSILGENVNKEYSWEQAKNASLNATQKDPDNIYNYFNLSVAYFNLKEYKNAVDAYEKVSTQLPFRTLWYQSEPIMAYYEIGNFDKVFAITDEILNGENSAYSELYFLRGNIYKKQDNLEAAKAEYEKAVYYNSNYKEAQLALQSLSSQ